MAGESHDPVTYVSPDSEVRGVDGNLSLLVGDRNWFRGLSQDPDLPGGLWVDTSK